MPDEQPRQDRVRLERPVTERHGARDRLVDAHLRLGELADLHQRLAEVGQQLEPLALALRQHVDRPPQQARGGLHVATRERPPPGRAELARAAPAELAALVVERRELEQVAARLLEMEADDLLELELAVALPVHALGPVGEPPVQPRADALRQAVVGRVADQDVVEPEEVGARRRRGARAGAPRPGRAARRSAPRLPGRAPRPAPSGRRARSPTPTRPRSARARAAGRGGPRAAPRSSPARRRPARSRGRRPTRRLRVAACPPRRTSTTSCSTNSGLPSEARTIRATAASGSAPPSTVLDEPSDVVGVERPEPHFGRAVHPRPLRVLFPELGPGRAEHEDRRIGEPSRRDVPRRSSSAVSAQWTSSNTATSGSGPGQALEELAGAPEELVERELHLGQADRRRDPLDHLAVLDQGGDPLARDGRRILREDPGGLGDHLDQRPERDPAPVGQASAA